MPVIGHSSGQSSLIANMTGMAVQNGNIPTLTPGTRSEITNFSNPNPTLRFGQATQVTIPDPVGNRKIQISTQKSGKQPNIDHYLKNAEQAGFTVKPTETEDGKFYTFISNGQKSEEIHKIFDDLVSSEKFEKVHVGKKVSLFGKSTPLIFAIPKGLAHTGLTYQRFEQEAFNAALNVASVQEDTGAPQQQPSENDTSKQVQVRRSKRAVRVRSDSVVNSINFKALGETFGQCERLHSIGQRFRDHPDLLTEVSGEYPNLTRAATQWWEEAFNNPPPKPEIATFKFMLTLLQPAIRKDGLTFINGQPLVRILDKLGQFFEDGKFTPFSEGRRIQIFEQIIQQFQTGAAHKIPKEVFRALKNVGLKTIRTIPELTKPYPYHLNEERVTDIENIMRNVKGVYQQDGMGLREDYEGFTFQDFLGHFKVIYNSYTEINESWSSAEITSSILKNYRGTASDVDTLLRYLEKFKQGITDTFYGILTQPNYSVAEKQDRIGIQLYNLSPLAARNPAFTNILDGFKGILYRAVDDRDPARRADGRDFEDVRRYRH